MSVEEVDDYLLGVDEPKRSTLEELRRSILAAAPEAEQGIAYGVPVFRIAGKNVAGFMAAKNHVSYLPHSGSVLETLPQKDLEGYTFSKGALRMPVDAPLPADLVTKLIAARRAEAGV